MNQEMFIIASRRNHGMPGVEKALPGMYMTVEQAFEALRDVDDDIRGYMGVFRCLVTVENEVSAHGTVIA